MDAPIKSLNKIRVARLIALIVCLTVTESVYTFLKGDRLTGTTLSLNVLVGTVLSFLLFWLVSQIKLKRIDLIALIWINLFIIRFFSNMLEGYFFTTVFSSLTNFVESLPIPLIITLLEGAFTGFLLITKISGERIFTSIRTYLSSRRRGSWILRVAAASVMYFPIYFFFGALINPFIIEYYMDPSFGLVIPPFSVILPLEFFRGFLYTISLLPVIAVVKERRASFFLLASLLFIPGAFIPLVMDTSLPSQIIPIHLIEILADSLVYGFVLSRLLSRPK